MQNIVKRLRLLNVIGTLIIVNLSSPPLNSSLIFDDPSDKGTEKSHASSVSQACYSPVYLVILFQDGNTPPATESLIHYFTVFLWFLPRHPTPGWLCCVAVLSCWNFNVFQGNIIYVCGPSHHRHRLHQGV